MRRSGSLSLVLIVVLAVGWLAYTLTLGGRSPQLGLDLQGGTSVVLAPKEKANQDQLDESIEIIRRRVDGLGVAEPEIERQGNFIVVSLPGVKNVDRAIQVVGETAKLQFRPFCGALPTHQPDATYQAALDPSGQFGGCVAPNGASSTTAGPGGASVETTPPAASDTTPAAPDGGSVPAAPSTPAGASQSGLGVPPQGHLSAAQQPATTDTTAPAAPATTAPARLDACSGAGASVPAAPTTTAPQNPLAMRGGRGGGIDDAGQPGHRREGRPRPERNGRRVRRARADRARRHRGVRRVRRRSRRASGSSTSR